MKVGILGSSDVAKSLARGFLKEGHQVMLGSREPAKLAAWVNENGKNASSGTLIETAKFGELVVLAVQGTKSVEAIRMAQPDNFKGKVLIDTTNPLDMSGGLPKLVGGAWHSSGELNQKGSARSVRRQGLQHRRQCSLSQTPVCWRPAGHASCVAMTQKQRNRSRASAKISVGTPLMSAASKLSHYLEATAMVWIITAVTGGHWNQAFKLLRK